MKLRLLHRTVASTLTFFAATLSGIAATGPLDSTKTRIAYPLDTAPVIDGEIDPAAEWAQASFRGWEFRTDDTLDDGLRGSVLASGAAPDDDGDLSVDIYAGVTEDALYIGVIVVDDDISTDDAAAGSENGATWQDDSVEIFIDGDNSNVPDRDTTGANPAVVDTGGQFVITANNAFRHAEAGNPAFGPDNGWYARTQESADGYHAEFRIPLSMIGNPGPGEFVGFTVGVNDDDEGGNAEGQLLWVGATHVEATYGNLFIGHRRYEGLKASAPTIDGRIGTDEYPGAEIVVINAHTGVYRVGDDDHTLDDHAFAWRLTHDEEAIYIAARVTDDNIVADTAEANSEDGQTWVDDSVEVFFDSNESNLNTRDQNEQFDGQFVFTTNGAWRDAEANNPTFGSDDDWFAASTIIDDHTWEVEFKIMKSALVGGQIEDLPMGFNININDDDEGARNEQLNWGGSPHNEYTYSELVLLSAIPSDPNAVADRNVRFGRLDKNSAQAEKTLSIRNAGSSQSLTLSNAAISGPNADAFTLVSFPETIAPGESALATIAFDSAGATGAFAATLTYQTNDPDPSEATLAAALSASVLNLGGPIARYALDETEGTVMLDATGYDRHGSYQGAALGQDPLVSGSSVGFVGGSHATVAGTSLGALDRFSVALTAQLDAVDGFQTLLARGPEGGSPNFALLNADGTLQWFTDGAPEFASSTSVLTAGATHHVVVVWSPTNATIYVDGAAVASQDNPAALGGATDDPLVLGSFFGNLDMNGRLDDIQIYNRAIDAEAVAFLAANPDAELELEGGNPEPEFTELWLLGDDSNGNQSEFSQEQGMDAAPGSAIAQDDDFYFRGIYPLPIGPVEADEPFLNYDRAHVPGDPFNRIHFNLDADSAATDTLLRMTFALCCFGAAEGGPSEHDMVFRLNGKEFFSEAGVNGDRVIQETVTAGDYDVVEGANTIEIERTGGSASAWVQYDYVRLEATAGAPVSPPDGGGGGGVEPDEPGTLPADSLADFGGPAVDNGWTYGYRNLDLADRTQDYDPNQDFIPFSADWWTGSQWDEPNVDGDNVPWTQLGPENTHPNGDNNGELHWTIRRWTSPGGNTEITWHLAKENLNCGNGVTGAVHVNGVRVDGATIASDDGVGVTRSITVALQRGDVVDLIHSPLGTDDTDNDGCDGSLMSMGFKAAEGGGGGGDALYAQDFNAHANDTADLGDGSIIASNDGTNSVQDGALRMTQAGVNGTAASFVLPPFDASTGWQATFDFVVEHSGENTPADGFSFNYGAIPAGENFGDPAEEGYGAAVPHVSFQVDTWLWNDAAGQDAGVGIELSGTELALTKAADDNANFKPNERVSASATLSWDPVQGASFTTTGLRTNADFLNVATPGFTGEAGYGFSILARTGGHNETVIIDNLVITALSAGPGTVPPHLLGYWPADEGSGSTVADVTGQGLDGTLNEGAWGTGIRGGAFDLSGADGGVSHVAVPPTGATFEEITIAGWINGVPTGDWTGLIQARGGAAPDQPIGIGFRGGTGNLAYTWNDNNGNTWDFDSGLAIPPNQWAFVALSLTPEGATLYVGADGQLQSATNAIAHLTQINANTSWYFGKDNCCGDARNFDGLMDEIALWDTALTEAELTALFNGAETPLTLIPGGGGGPGPANFILQDVGLSAEGAFQLTIPAGLSADIEYSTDLIQWEVIATGLDGTVQETDAGRLAAPQGYYRARQ